MYDYKAQILRVIDGDTVHLDVDLGLEIHQRIKCRLARINAPELATPEGKASRAYLLGMLDLSRVYDITTVKDHQEKYGRYLVEIMLPSGASASDTLVVAEQARYWDGKGPRP